MWSWGTRLGDPDEETRRKLYGDTEVPNYSKPRLITWFQEQEISVLEVKSGAGFCVVKTKDKVGKLEFYALGQNANATKS